VWFQPNDPPAGFALVVKKPHCKRGRQFADTTHLNSAKAEERRFTAISPHSHWSDDHRMHKKYWRAVDDETDSMYVSDILLQIIDVKRYTAVVSNPKN
jgi:hypothetical protein